MRTARIPNQIEKFLNGKVGQQVEPEQIAQAVECTIQSVYAYIRKNPQRFTKVTRGTFKINAAANQSFLNNEGTI